ncbi:hypothetical protein [Rubripirellula amarantea]|uniref:hypothetical protein n=1 Tax=Rubripirellula amarantea TaxID=2527999 RepID=UPI0011B3743F|nr:hypothetical protein [Rubripirellula amarantea]
MWRHLRIGSESDVGERIDVSEQNYRFIGLPLAHTYKLTSRFCRLAFTASGTSKSRPSTQRSLEEQRIMDMGGNVKARIQSVIVPIRSVAALG